MLKKFGCMVVVLAMATVMGCMSPGPPFKSVEPPAEGKAVVYVYRPWTMMGGSDIPAVYDNGEKVLSGIPLRNYWRYETEPGQHVMKAKAWTTRAIPVTLNLNGDTDIRYVRIEYKFGVPYAFKMVEVSEDVAKDDLKSTYRVKEREK